MLLLLIALIALTVPAYCANGDGDWSAFPLPLLSSCPFSNFRYLRAAAYAKATTALSKLNNTDKVNIVTGIGWEKGPCVGNTGAAPSIGYPSLCLQDSPLG